MRLPNMIRKCGRRLRLAIAMAILLGGLVGAGARSLAVEAEVLAAPAADGTGAELQREGNTGSDPVPMAECPGTAPCCEFWAGKCLQRAGCIGGIWYCP